MKSQVIVRNNNQYYNGNCNNIQTKKKKKTQQKTNLRLSWETIVNIVFTYNITSTKMKNYILEAMMTGLDKGIGNLLMRMIQTVISCTSTEETDGCRHGTDYFTELKEIQDFYKELFPLEQVEKSIPSLHKLITAIHRVPSMSHTTDSSTYTYDTSVHIPTDRVAAEDAPY